jgi:hypothetical protein
MLFLFLTHSSCYDVINVRGVTYTQINQNEFGVGNPNGKNAITEKNKNVKIEPEVAYKGKIYSVASINDYAFNECSHLFSISLPKTIKSIGKYAFFNCITLDSIVIPKNVEIISEHCFSGCVSLNSIQMSAELYEIGRNAFENCRNLKFAIIPTNVARIGKDAFKSCSELVLLVYDGKYRMAEDIFGTTFDENKIHIYVTCDYHSDFFGKIRIRNPCTGNNRRIVLINRMMAIFIAFFTVGVMALFRYMSS